VAAAKAELTQVGAKGRSVAQQRVGGQRAFCIADVVGYLTLTARRFFHVLSNHPRHG
jgi:hypothetical protein